MTGLGRLTVRRMGREWTWPSGQTAGQWPISMDRTYYRRPIGQLQLDLKVLIQVTRLPANVGLLENPFSVGLWRPCGQGQL